MDRKRELKMQYKEIKIEAGIYQIKNIKNGKILIESTRNLKTINGRKFMMSTGGHPNRLLQAEWNEFGNDAFVFEVLEVLKKKESGSFDEKSALAKLEEIWLDELQPYGDRGYHQEK